MDSKTTAVVKTLWFQARSISLCMFSLVAAQLLVKKTSALQSFVVISIFFLLGEGEGECEAPGRGRGIGFSLKIPRGGGVPGGGGEGPEGVCGKLGILGKGGGGKIFFFGAETSTKRKANVAVQLLQRNFPKSLVACCRKVGFRGCPKDPSVLKNGLSQLLGPHFPKGPKIEKNQSRLKFSISIEIFNPGPSEFPTKIGIWWVARLKISISIENFNPGWRS